MSSGSDTNRINFLQSLIQYITSQPGRQNLPGNPINFYCGASPSSSPSSSSAPSLSGSSASCPPTIKCPENVISLQDLSTKNRYTTADLNVIITALNKHLASFCNDWSLQTTTVKLYDANTTVSAFYRLYLKDDTDVPGANGYHSVGQDGSLEASVFIETIGSDRLFTDPAPLIKSDGIKRGLSVPAVICHEVMEMLSNRFANSGVPVSSSLNIPTDPNVGQVTDLMTGEVVDIAPIFSEEPKSIIWIPYESIDAVQANLVEVAEQSKVIHLSDYLLPAWFSVPTSTPNNYNYLKNITEPFHIDIGGYTMFLYKDKLYYNTYFLPYV